MLPFLSAIHPPATPFLTDPAPRRPPRRPAPAAAAAPRRALLGAQIVGKGVGGFSISAGGAVYTGASMSFTSTPTPVATIPAFSKGKGKGAVQSSPITIYKPNYQVTSTPASFKAGTFDVKFDPAPPPQPVTVKLPEMPALPTLGKGGKVIG